MTPTAPASLIREMRAIMSEPIEQHEWWEDLGNIAALLRWLHAEHNFAAEELIAVVGDPWAWDAEYRQMLAGQSPATVDLTAILLAQE